MTRVVVVTKRSNFGQYVLEENDPRVQMLLETDDPVIRHWRSAHDDHVRTLDEVQKTLDRLGAHHFIIRDPMAQFDAGDAALVIAVGGDGTLLAASHNVNGVPLLGINSSPRTSVGFYCGARRKSVRAVIPLALEAQLEGVWLARMQVTVDGRVRSRRVLNEALFCHSVPAATSRYILSYGRIREEQRSSGLWIGPAPGSTAAQHSAGGRVLPLESRQLQFVVREPYLAFGRTYRLLREVVEPGHTVSVKSKMQSGLIFLDGPYKRIAVRLGEVVTFGLSDEPLQVLGLQRHRSRASTDAP